MSNDTGGTGTGSDKGAATTDATMAAALEALRQVVDPELGADVVTLGMVGELSLADGELVVPVALTTSACPLRSQLRDDVVRHASGLDGVRHVRVTFSELDAAGRSLLMARARRNAQLRAVPTAVPPTARVLAVASGKGGVGKSCISVHTAAALARRGFRVGLLDADIGGHSVPGLLGITGRLAATAGPDGDGGAGGRIVPLELDCGQGRLAVVSTALIVDDEATALLWRGPVLARALEHFLCDVEWGPLDYLVVDLPPGTSDVHMALARLVPHTDVVVVTTPEPGAARVAALAADMARRANLRIAGVVENMTHLRCPHGDALEVFGPPAGVDFAAQLGVPLLASVPLDARLSVPGSALAPRDGGAGDGGRAPGGRDGVVGEGDVAVGEMARMLAEDVAPPLDLSSCTSRLLLSLERAARAADEATGAGPRH